MMREPPSEAVVMAMAEASGVAGVAELNAAENSSSLPPDAKGAGTAMELMGERRPPAAKPSARFLTIVVVLTTFMAALGGFLLNRASAASSNDGDVAQELSLEASAAQTSAYQQAETDYAQYQSLQALKGAAAQAMLEATYPQPGAKVWADRYWSDTQQVDEAALQVPADVKPYLANGNPDPNFPYDFFARRAAGGTYLEAKSDAYNDVSGKWSSLVDSYTAMLTMVAGALFLFGSAFVLYGRNRLLFSFLGGALVATALVWGAALTITREPSTPSETAARDYANGVTAMDAAISPSGYGPSIKDFTEAIALRPDYALAYAERAAAEAYRGSETEGAGFVSITSLSPYWARLSATDELEAYNLGDHEAAQLINVGWAYYALWVVSGGTGQPPAIATSFFQRATVLDPTDPVAWLDLGGSYIATSHFKAGAHAIAAGVTRMLFTCTASGGATTCDKPQPATSHLLQQAWFAGAMESLEALRGTQEARQSAAMRAAISKEIAVLTGSVAAGSVASGAVGAPIKVPGLSGFLDPNYLELTVPVPQGLSAQQLADMPITVVWYQKPATSSRWTAISETACWGHGQETCGRYDAAQNSFQFITQLLEADNQCFTDVEYKAELYVGGNLSGSLALSPKQDAITTNLAPALAKAMNTGICVPSTWALQTLKPVTLPVYGGGGTVSGPLTSSEAFYAPPGQAEGAYLFRLYPERTTAAGGPRPGAAVVQAGVNTAMAILRGRGLPSDIRARESQSVSIWGAGLSDMTATGFVSTRTHVEALVGAALVALQGTPPSAAAEDRSASASVSEDYAVVVAVVYAPARSGLFAGAHPLGLQIFSSFSLLDYG